MFLVKSLGRLMFGEKSELVQVGGSLYRGDRCLFLHAQATIKKSSQPHAFTLIVTRLVQDDVVDHEEEQGDGDVGDELSFFLAPELCYWTSPNGAEFNWRHQDNPDTPSPPVPFKFVAADSPSNSPALLQLFDITVLQCMYEWANQTGPEDATEDDLLAFKASSSSSSSAAAASYSPRYHSPHLTSPHLCHCFPRRSPPDTFLLCSSKPAPTTPTKSSEPIRRDIPAPVTPAPKTPGPQTPAGAKKGKATYAKPDGLVDDTREILAVRGNFFWFDPFQGVYELQAEAVVVSILQKSAGLRCNALFPSSPTHLSLSPSPDILPFAPPPLEFSCLSRPRCHWQEHLHLPAPQLRNESRLLPRQAADYHLRQ